MIPPFPTFKKIFKEDKALLETYTKHLPPYSDYNFLSLFTWDTDQSMAVSELNQNLVVKFSDYETDEQFLSLLGTNKINGSLSTLFDYLSQHQEENLTLKLVPEETAQEVDESSYEVVESRDHFDYIYDIEELNECRGKKFETIRNMSNRFCKRFPEHQEVELDLKNKSHQQLIFNLLNRWKENRQKDLPKEEQAIKSFLEIAPHEDGTHIGIIYEDKLIAFCCIENAREQFAMAHYAKVDTTYSGVNQHLMRIIAAKLSQKGVKFLNYEQDLGIESLRHVKQSFRPIRFLKKFEVTPKKMTTNNDKMAREVL